MSYGQGGWGRGAYGQGAHEPAGHGATGGGQVPVVIRVETARLAGRFGPSSMKLPILAQIGGAPRWSLQAGDNPIGLPPGVWPLKVHCSYYGIKTGRAEITIDTRPGQPVLLYYMTPRTIYDRGVLAYQPTDRPGKTTLLLIYLMPLLVVGVAVLSGLLVR